MKSLIIIGSGGHTRSVLSTAKLMKNWNNFKIIDVNFNNQQELILGVEVISFEDVFNIQNIKNTDFFISIGDNKKRESVYKNLTKKNLSFSNVIHPNSCIGENSQIGKGNFLGPFSNVGPTVEVGDFNIINSFANLEHESKLGNFNHLAPSSTICGRSKLSNNIFVGSNSVIIEKLNIAENNFIGAGAVVTNSIESTNGKYVGVPARKI